MHKYCWAVNETCPQNVLREVMAKIFQNVAHTSRKQFEEVSCTHTFKKKRTCLKAQFQGIMRCMQIQPQTGSSSHQSE